MLYETEGLFLSQMDLGEYDRIATILTRDEGLVKAVVKGARKPLSKLSAITQPYGRATVQMYRGRTLDRVTQAALLTSYPGIVLDYRRMVYAGFLAELISMLLPIRESNEAVYDFTCLVFKTLESREDPWPIAMWGAMGILARAGFAPSFGACAVCGCDPSTPLFFSAEAGGIVCEKCRGSSSYPDELHEISAGAARTLDLLSSSDTAPAVNARGNVRWSATAVLLDYIAETLGKRLNSASLVENIEAEPRLRE